MSICARVSGRDWGQKIGQVLTAAELERHWRKDQILEACLNLAPSRGEIDGIDALSRTLFGEAPQGLDAREAASTAPTDGTVLARDPDIPPQLQRVELTASAADVRWQVDGRPLGRGARR